HAHRLSHARRIPAVGYPQSLYGHSVSGLRRECKGARARRTDGARAMTEAAVRDWIARARATPIESGILSRGIKVKRSGAERIGPCPKCGGTDRFSINVKEGVWNCRQCKPDDISGDVIGLVEHLDNCGFEQAVETLTQESKPNGYDGNVTRLRREV